MRVLLGVGISFFTAALVLGCGPSSQGPGHHHPDGGGPAGLVSIAITPADATVAVESGVAMPLTYSAVGTFSDGHQEPLADATFALDGAAQKLAVLAGAQLTASGFAAGTGQVSASSGGKSPATPP